MEKVKVTYSSFAGDGHGFVAEFVFIDGSEGRHTEFKRESCPDVRLKISGYITKEGVMVETERLIKLLNLDVVNRDRFIPEVKNRLK